MIAAVRRHWIAGLLAVGLTLGMISLLNVASAIGQPFGGFYADRNQSRNVWEVGGATPTWWSALAEGVVRYEDVLLTLGNRPYGPETRREYAALWAAGRTEAPLTLQRGSETLTVSVPLQLFTVGNFLDLKLPDFLQGLGFWLLALAVYRARPQEPVNRVFAIACGAIAASVWVALGSLFMEEPSGVTRALNLVWVLAIFCLGPVVIHLAVLFPDPARRFSPHRLAVGYILMGGVAALLALSYLLRWQNTALNLAYPLSSFGYQAIYLVFGLGFFFYIARLSYLVWQPARSRRARRQARLMLGGLLCAVPYVLVVLLRALFANTSSYFWSGLDLRFLVLAVPLTFAYVILRYQTSQSSHPLLIDVFILTVSVLLASLGAWSIHLFTPDGASLLNNFSPFALLFVAALISGLLWRRQSRWQAALNRLFLPELRGYGAVWQFGRQVVGQTRLAQLPSAIAAALVTHLELERAVVWLWDETKKIYALAGQAGDWKEPPLNDLSPDSRLLPHPVRLLEATPDWLAPARSRGSIEVIAPLSVSGQPIGLLGLGQRGDEEIFDERDLEILDLIAQQSALFLLTALQIEQLRQVPLQVNAAQERERFTIAQELHDTVQQFLGRLPFYLQVSRDSLRADPVEAEALLQRCIADVESEAQTVRQIRNNLAPMQLERSLAQPLRLLIEHFCIRSGLEMYLDFPPELDACLTLEARHALYRVVQQALDNVCEHAQAGQVMITFKCEVGRILFSIADNGRGFSEADQATAEDDGSFGLKSMRARITVLGGEFSLRSTPGRGTEISGWLPASPPSSI